MFVVFKTILFLRNDGDYKESKALRLKFAGKLYHRFAQRIHRVPRSFL